MSRLAELNTQLKNEHMPLANLKIFSNAFGVNSKIDFINTLDKGIRGTCSRILDFFEARVNTDINNDKYMIVYASQQEIGDTLALSREYVSYCINRMSESQLCIFTKVRQGLNKSNYYIIEKKKQLIELLKEIFRLQEEQKKASNYEKQNDTKKSWGKKKESTFNNFGQRKYDSNALENMLLGYDEYDPDKLLKE